MEFVVGTISLSVNCFHFRAAVFVYVGPTQLCMENGILFYMCSAVWLARNIRHSCTSVRLRLVAFTYL